MFTNVSVSAGDEDNSSTTPVKDDEALNASRQPAVVQLTSSGTDVDPDSSDLISGLKLNIRCSILRLYDKTN